LKRKTINKLLIFGGIALILLLLAAGGLIYLNRHAKTIADGILEKEIKESGFGQVYDISYRDIRLNVFGGKFTIVDLKIVPHESFFDSPDSIRFKYPVVFQVKIPELSVEGLIKNLSLNAKNIHLGKVGFIRPEVNLISHLSKGEKQEAKVLAQQRSTAGEKNIPGLENFHIDDVSIKNGRFSFYDRDANDTVVTAGKVNFKLSDFGFVPGYDMASLAGNIFKDARISLADIKYPIANGFYILKMGEVANHKEEGSVSVQDIRLIPQYEKGLFGEKFGKQTDRIEGDLKTLEINGLDVEKLLVEKSVSIQNIIIDGLFMNVYRDKTVPFDDTQFPLLPQQLLANLQLEVMIEKIEIKNSEVVYEELVVDALLPGHLSISSLYATITGVTNMPEMIMRNGPMRWDIQADIFEAGALEVQILFTPDITKPDFSFKGRMGAMNMTAFNSMIEHTENLRIDQGYIKSLTFEAEANEEFADGTLVMAYDSLQITGLKTVREDEVETLGFLTAIANTVIRKFNPHRRSSSTPDTSIIFMERDKNKGIFNYLAKSAISGIKATIVPSIISPKKKYENEQRRKARKERRNSGK
jgi:hypothetical protein